MSRLAANTGAQQTIPSSFGSLSPGSPTQIAVGANSIQLLAANSNRKYAHIMNNSGSTIYIQYQSDAVLNTGIRLSPNTLYTIDFTNLWLGSINAIGAENNLLIDILEGE